jgi:hypothetical protein
MRKRMIFRPVRRIGARELIFCLLELAVIYFSFDYSPILLGQDESEVLYQLILVLTGATSFQLVIILLHELWLYRGVSGINRYPAYMALSIHLAIGVNGLVVSLHCLELI